MPGSLLPSDEPKCCPFGAHPRDAGHHETASGGTDMSRIHRRSAGSWEVVIEAGRDPQTAKRLRRTFTVRGTKRDAEREAAQQTTALTRGTYVDPSRETAGEFLVRWLRDYVEPSLSLRSRLRYRDIVERAARAAVGRRRLGGDSPGGAADARLAPRRRIPVNDRPVGKRDATLPSMFGHMYVLLDRTA